MRRWWQALAILLVIVAGWLYFSAPGFRVNNIDTYVWCDPLAPQIGTQVSLYSSPGERGEIVDQYVDSMLHDGQNRDSRTVDRVRSTLDLRCQDARTGQQTTLNIVLAFLVITAIWWRPRTSSNLPLEDPES